MSGTEDVAEWQTSTLAAAAAAESPHAGASYQLRSNLGRCPKVTQVQR